MRLMLADLTIALAACAAATVGVAAPRIQRALAVVPLGAAALAYPRSRAAAALLGVCALFMFVRCEKS